MLDYRTVVVHGWKVAGSKNVKNFINDLEEWDEEYYDNGELENVMIEDTMCGNYVYLGAVLAYFDSTEDEEVIIDDKVKDATNKWNKFLEKNPEFENIVNKYKSGEPKLYVFSHIW